MADKRPNILYIFTDQQHRGMMSCTGNDRVQTSAMDSIAANGTRFDLAYCSNPVCGPSRVSMLTGQMPSRFGITNNFEANHNEIPEADLGRSMGWPLKNAGYRTAYGGKQHFSRAMQGTIGFDEILTKNDREVLADKCVEFIERDDDRPFLLVASFINPHDICFITLADMARATGQPRKYGDNEGYAYAERAAKIPGDMPRDEFIERFCPPLPDNFEPQEGEPESFIPAGGEQAYTREHWTEADWRFYRWVYGRMTESVDAKIGRVLDALRRKGLEENTVIVFSSDHGDMDAAHRLAHKTAFYEESAGVPMIVSHKGVTPPGRVDRTHLVAAGLDLIPTFCDFAGVEAPAELPGRSLRALAEGRDVADWRGEVCAENARGGRMIRDIRYKYCVYPQGERREQLMDLQADPGEMRNLIDDPDHQAIRDDLLQRLRDWMLSIEDQAGLAILPDTVSAA